MLPQSGHLPKTHSLVTTVAQLQSVFKVFFSLRCSQGVKKCNEAQIDTATLQGSLSAGFPNPWLFL